MGVTYQGINDWEAYQFIILAKSREGKAEAKKVLEVRNILSASKVSYVHDPLPSGRKERFLHLSSGVDSGGEFQGEILLEIDEELFTQMYINSDCQ